MLSGRFEDHEGNPYALDALPGGFAIVSLPGHLEDPDTQTLMGRYQALISHRPELAKRIFCVFPDGAEALRRHAEMHGLTIRLVPDPDGRLAPQLRAWYMHHFYTNRLLEPPRHSMVIASGGHVIADARAPDDEAHVDVLLPLLDEPVPGRAPAAETEVSLHRIHDV